MYAALTSAGSPKAVFNHLQRNPSDQVVKKLLSRDIKDFVGDGAALAVESMASALQLLEPLALPRFTASADVQNVCVSLVYADEIAAQLEALSSLSLRH